MDAQKVDAFLLSKGTDYFPSEYIPWVREQLLKMDDSKYMLLMSTSFKSPVIALVLSLLVGAYGVDRFYLGNIGLGVGKLLTLGGLGIWAIIDWFLIMGATRKHNLDKLNEILTMDYNANISAEPVVFE